MLGLSWRFYTQLTCCNISDDFEKLLENQPDLINIDEVIFSKFSAEIDSLDITLSTVLDRQFSDRREISRRSQMPPPTTTSTPTIPPSSPRTPTTTNHQHSNLSEDNINFNNQLPQPVSVINSDSQTLENPTTESIQQSDFPVEVRTDSGGNPIK